MVTKFGDQLNLHKNWAYTERTQQLTGTFVLAMVSASASALSRFMNGLKPPTTPNQPKNLTQFEKKNAFNA